MKSLKYISLILLILQACVPKKAVDLEGIWRAEVPTSIGPIPFHLAFETQNDSIKVFAINGEEKLELDKAFWQNDSLHISMEVFDAEIITAVDGDRMTGIYRKKLGSLDNRQGSFTAEKRDLPRFPGASETVSHQINGKWATTFETEEDGNYEAVGLFNQKGNEITGTFLTTTGDYRYLQGNIVEDSLKISCFDGTHIFLFKAKIESDSSMSGKFSSSLLYEEKWTAKKDENAALPDADSLTYLNPGFSGVEFSFPNEKGEMVSLNDEKYKDKVVIVQILGSWCPNCMDESKFYVKWLAEHPEAPVEIVGLAFEKKNEADFAFPKIEKMKKRFGIPYEILLAGSTSEEDRSKALPMLNRIMSFPTSIYIDKKGMVRKIHTGFSGPGTGEYYQKFTEDFDRFMAKLINE